MVQKRLELSQLKFDKTSCLVAGYASFSRSAVELSPQTKGDSAEVAVQAINEWLDSTRAD